MDTLRTSGLVALLLIVTGTVAYVASGMSSFTAMIPAFLGLVVGALVALAQARPGARRGATRAVLGVGVVGALGSLWRVVPAVAGGEIALPVAFAAQAVTAVLCVWLVAAVGRRMGAEA